MLCIEYVLVVFYYPPSSRPLQNPLGASNSVEGVHGLTTQLGQLQISTTNAFSPQPQHTTQYQLAAPHGGTHYTQQTPGGWTISHPIPNTPLLQQVFPVLLCN